MNCRQIRQDTTTVQVLMFAGQRTRQRPAALNDNEAPSPARLPLDREDVASAERLLRILADRKIDVEDRTAIK